MRRAEGGAKIFGVFRVKITILRQKIICFPILGGGGPGSAPAICIVFCHLRSRFIVNSNMPSFLRFVKKWAIYRLGIISLAHAPVHVTDFPVVNVHVDELSSARIWQHNLCATLATNVNINYRLPIKIYYRICTLRNIRIEIIHGSQNVFWALLISVNPC